MVVGFCSIAGWCYSWWWVRDLRTLAQFHDIKLQSHENVSIKFENLYVTETATLIVLNQGKNYGIDKIIDVTNLVM